MVHLLDFVEFAGGNHPLHFLSLGLPAPAASVTQASRVSEASFGAAHREGFTARADALDALVQNADFLRLLGLFYHLGCTRSWGSALHQRPGH